MKTVIYKEANRTFETLKRALYSFQVLIVGIAIPALFLIGISNSSQTEQSHKGTVNHLNNTEIVVKPVGDLAVAQM